MKNVYFIPLIIVLLVISALVLSKSKAPNQSAQSAVSGSVNKSEDMAKKEDSENKDTAMKEDDKNKGSADEVDHGSKLAGSKIDLQNVNSLKPGDVTLAFKLYGADTQELGLKDLKINNDKPVHLLIVRSDMTGYQHLYPEYINDRWTVATNIPQLGNYNLYVSVEPMKEKAMTLRLPVVIGEATEKKNFPIVSKSFSETVDNITVMLDLANPIKKTKEEIDLNFKITENNNPATQIDPYLGNFGNAIVFSHTDPDHFENANSMTQTKPVDGIAKFKAKFPMDGMYTIFTQFNINGQVKTFPITIEVGEKKDTQKDEHM